MIFWLVQGKSNDEIAAILRIRPDSVSRNRLSIYTKMGVDQRVAATLHSLSLARRRHAAVGAATGGAMHLGVETLKAAA